MTNCSSSYCKHVRVHQYTSNHISDSFDVGSICDWWIGEARNRYMRDAT